MKKNPLTAKKAKYTAIFFILTVITYTAVVVCDITVVVNISYLTAPVINNSAITNILSQLKNASVDPPHFITAAFSAVSGFLGVWFSGSRRKYIKAFSVIIIVIIVLLSFVITLYYTKINGVGINVAIKTLTNILKSGLI